MRKRTAIGLLMCALLVGLVQAPSAAQRLDLFEGAESIEGILTSPDYEPSTDAQLLRYYIAFFDRQPDIAGAKYWIGLSRDGHDPRSISGWMASGLEFSNTYAGLTDEEYLERVYGNVLGRDFDQGGYDYWLDFLKGENVAGGNPGLQRLGRSEVVFFVAQSVEFANSYPFNRPAISFSGLGDEVVEVNVPTDYFVVDGGHEGTSNFSVWSVVADGERNDLLFNEIGAYEGRVFGEEPRGKTAALEIRADGAWTIDFNSIDVVDVYSDGTYSGFGDDVIRLSDPASGLTVGAFTHNGDSNFSIWGRRLDGKRLDLLVNEIGSYSGESLVEDGIQILTVRADGDWTVLVE